MLSPFLITIAGNISLGVIGWCICSLIKNWYLVSRERREDRDAIAAEQSASAAADRFVARAAPTVSRADMAPVLRRTNTAPAAVASPTPKSARAATAKKWDPFGDVL